MICAIHEPQNHLLKTMLSEGHTNSTKGKVMPFQIAKALANGSTLYEGEKSCTFLFLQHK